MPLDGDDMLGLLDEAQRDEMEAAAAWEEEQERRWREVIDDPATEEHYIDKLYDSIVHDFKTNRLQKFFITNPRVAKPAIDAFRNAWALKTDYYSASVVFSASSIELCLHQAMIRPIVYGLIINDGCANILFDLVGAAHSDKTKKIFLRVLASQFDIDLKQYKRSASNTPLWEEITLVQKERNDILHRGKTTSDELCRFALDVSQELLGSVFLRVIEAIGLHNHEEGLVICNDITCSKRNPVSMRELS